MPGRLPERAPTCQDPHGKSISGPQGFGRVRPGTGGVVVAVTIAVADQEGDGAQRCPGVRSSRHP